MHDTADFDRSRPTRSRSDRAFWGAEVKYQGGDRHEPYLFGLTQDDQNNQRPYNERQNFRYDSRYYGAGLSGELFPRLRYQAEGVMEQGESQAYNTATQPRDLSSDIEAYAFTGALEYFFNHETSPRLVTEYLWGSGDENRNRPANTIDGNQAYTTDRTFSYFGYLPTGFSLAPKISNIHVFKVGSSCSPVRDRSWMESLETGVNLYAYLKDETAGGISDNRVTGDKRLVGYEHDVYANWKVFTDLVLGIRYGVFYQGDAYAQKRERHFLETSLVYMF